MACLDDEVLLDLAEGRVGLNAALKTHLAACQDCRRVLAAAARGAGTTLRCAGFEDPHIEPAWDELGEGVVVAGRYTLEQFVGAGGMGVVWSARRKEDGAEVALKIARTMDDETMRRFEREARIGAAIEHPSVMRTLEFIPSTTSRGPCLVQELLVGETLEARLRREGTLPLREAARVLLPVAAALRVAHARGIVHRDLKPQNVFLTSTRVVVLDFGIARLLPEWGPHSKLTRTGAVMGTPLYMAPEQIFGEPDIDARADVWALGSILFRVLGGRPPVTGTTLGDAMKALRRSDGVDFTILPRDLPLEIVSLLGAALTVPREGRFGDVARVIATLGPHAV